MPQAPDIAIQKKRLREAAIAARTALGQAARKRMDDRIAKHLECLLAQLSPRTLGFCWPHRDEPDLRAFVTGWLAADTRRRAALPVVQRQSGDMLFRHWHVGSEMRKDRYGIPYPAAGEILLPDALLVPLNAFDAAGFRIGYGGGYFDRTLAALEPRPVAIGIGYECGRAGSALPEPHDRPMQWLVTEEGSFAPAPPHP